MLEPFIFVNNYIIGYPHVITWGGVILLVFLGIFLQRVKIKEAIAEYKLKLLLRKTGVDSRHNIVIPGGIDGSIFIENLILMPNEIFLLGVKKFQGLIFAGEKIDLWTQVIGNKSYKFQNPLHLLESNVVSLNSMIKASTVGKKVLFINGSEFPKGKPENIVSLEKLKAWGRDKVEKNVPATLKKDWDTLTALEMKADLAKDTGLLIDNKVSFVGSLFSQSGLILVIGFWLFWRLM